MNEISRESQTDGRDDEEEDKEKALIEWAGGLWGRREGQLGVPQVEREEVERETYGRCRPKAMAIFATLLDLCWGLMRCV